MNEAQSRTLENHLDCNADLLEQGLITEEEFVLVLEILEDWNHTPHVALMKEFSRYWNKLAES
jgi:hypothetical protein